MSALAPFIAELRHEHSEMFSAYAQGKAPEGAFDAGKFQGRMEALEEISDRMDRALAVLARHGAAR